MPRYDYKCPECEKEVEVEHSITEAPELICDECSVQMKRCISGRTSFVLNGSGWAKDGYKG